MGKQQPARECVLEIATQIGMERVTMARHTAGQKVAVGSIDAVQSKKLQEKSESKTERGERNDRKIEKKYLGTIRKRCNGSKRESTRTRRNHRSH